MDKSEFKKKLGLIEKIAQKHRWTYVSNDLNTFRISYKDELSIYRIDIYLSKMTVCLSPAGDKPVYFKRQNFEMIEAIFKQPHAYEMGRVG